MIRLEYAILETSDSIPEYEVGRGKKDFACFQKIYKIIGVLKFKKIYVPYRGSRWSV